MEKRVTPLDREFLRRLSESRAVRFEVHSHFRSFGITLDENAVMALAAVWHYYGEITSR